MELYQQLVAEILRNGDDNTDRTGTGTRSIFGHQMRFDLNAGFPLVTTKRTFWRGAFTELLWMLRGDTNIAWLNEHGVHIWDEWADANGDLGPIYGAQWRRDNQLGRLLYGLRDHPHSRRHVMSAWNPTDLPAEALSPQENVGMGLMALAPCHCLVQFHVSSDNELSCQLYQRSADVFLGVPFNIAGYALLTHLLAHHLGMKVGALIWTGGDCHLYANHFEQAKELLTREPRSLPELDLRHLPSTPLWEIDPDQLRVVGYLPHPTIKAQVSV